MINCTEKKYRKNSLPKRERLSGTKRIDTLFKESESGFSYPFRYFFRVIPIEQQVEGGKRSVVETAQNTALLISVPKRYHKRANKRNLIKRRTKELYRTNKDMLYNKVLERNIVLHIALIYSVKDVVEYKKIEDAVKKIFAAVSARI